MMVSIQNIRPRVGSKSPLFKFILGWFIGSDARILWTLHRNCGDIIFPLFVFSCLFATFPCLMQHSFKWSAFFPHSQHPHNDSYQPGIPYPHYHSNQPLSLKPTSPTLDNRFQIFRCELLSSRSSRLLPICTGSDKCSSQNFFCKFVRK